MKTALIIISAILLLSLQGCKGPSANLDATLTALKSPVIVVAADNTGAIESLKPVTFKDSVGTIVTVSCNCLSSLNVGDTLK